MIRLEAVGKGFEEGEGQIKQVSFNNYDRAPQRVAGSPEAERRFYRSYHAFHQKVSERSRWWTLKLGVGDSLYFNNWRLLHGRLAYSGRRVFVGCYQNMEDFESKRRVLEGTGVTPPQGLEDS